MMQRYDMDDVSVSRIVGVLRERVVQQFAMCTV
jgi:hypothetical protein